VATGRGRGGFLASYSIEVLAQPQGDAAKAGWVVSTASSLLFAADYVARLSLAPNPRRWFVRHLFDLAVVKLPLLRPLRLLRLVVLIGALNKAVDNAIRGRVVIYAVSGAALLVYVAALAILQAERPDPGADIKTFGQAVWWAITTVTTVGYGDLSPVTTAGRVIAALLMVGGISLVGVVTRHARLMAGTTRRRRGHRQPSRNSRPHRGASRRNQAPRRGIAGDHGRGCKSSTGRRIR
jgi:voltage-gated potassium channel